MEITIDKLRMAHNSGASNTSKRFFFSQSISPFYTSLKIKARKVTTQNFHFFSSLDLEKTNLDLRNQNSPVLFGGSVPTGTRAHNKYYNLAVALSIVQSCIPVN